MPSTEPPQSTIVELNGLELTSADIHALATRQATGVVPDEARARAAESNRYAVEVSSQRQLYGRSTGVGANRGVDVADADAHAARLLGSHATSAGPVRSERRIRATLAVRINQLAAGGSGARPELLDALLDLLHRDTLPPVREYGSIGTGDLPALATIGMALPIRLEAHDVLPLLSSNAATIADGALAQVELSRLSHSAIQVAASSFDAVSGNPEAFSAPALSATPFDGARQVCEAILKSVGRFEPARIQDPYGLRALPQVHGAFLDALAELDRVISAYASAPAENPVLLPGVGVAHHGGFHAARLGQALDGAVLSAAQSAQLSLARLAMLVEPAHTTLPAFLADGTPGASGVMICEYAAASALSHVKALSAPAGVQSISLSRAAEEDASFASLAARQALDVVEAYRVVLGCELVAAVRALRMLGRRVPAQFDSLPADMGDRDLTEDILRAGAMLESTWA